jgi:EpsI family protein
MVSNWRFFLAGLLLVGASGLAYALRPTPIVEARDVNLEHQIPTSFGEWHEVHTGLVQVDLAPRGENGEEEASLRWPYDQTLTRVYQRADGQMIMLALAWGSKQRQEIKVHRPELCYAGQGLQIVEQRNVSIELSTGGSVEANRLLTRNASRVEPVTYWIRIGDNIMAKGRKVRIEIFQQALRGRIPDGILFRVSQALPPSGSADASYKVQEAFIRELLSSVDQGGRRLLIGSVGGGSSQT